ncbi:TolC family protein [Labilibacter sediminis]|nr:TolC family protein [Labilibacter sediminis]
MTTKTRLLILQLLLASSIICKGQSDTLQVSLSQALAYATEFGYQSINASHDIDIAKKQVNEYLAIGLPQVNASGSLANNLKLQENRIQFGDTTITTVFGTKYNNSIGARVDQLLFDGSYFIGVKASKVYVRLSEKSKTKTEIDIKQAVSEAYFLTLIAQQNIIDFEQSLRVNERTLKQTQAYYDNGLSEDIDVDQIRLMVNESRRLYLEAKSQLNIAIVVLKFTMGYDIDKPLKLTDSIDAILAPIPLNPENSFDISTHIDYQMMNTQIDVQSLVIKNQRAQAMPKLNAFVNYDFGFFGDQMSDLTVTEGSMLGLSLSIPIFSSGMRSAQLKQEKITMNKLSVDKQMLEQSLKSDWVVAKANLANAKEQYDNAVEAKNIALSIYRKSLIKFENGLLTSLDLSQYENRLVESYISYRNASVKYFNQYITYQKATSQL